MANQLQNAVAVRMRTQESASVAFNAFLRQRPDDPEFASIKTCLPLTLLWSPKIVTILRSGASEKYSQNWASAFGEDKSGTKSKTTKKNAAANAATAKAKSVKPTAAKAKSAAKSAPSKPAKKKAATKK